MRKEKDLQATATTATSTIRIYQAQTHSQQVRKEGARARRRSGLGRHDDDFNQKWAFPWSVQTCRYVFIHRVTPAKKEETRDTSNENPSDDLKDTKPTICSSIGTACA
jgi:hypothetical protein